jgi:hypothetical protein
MDSCEPKFHTAFSKLSRHLKINASFMAVRGKL